MSTFRRALIVLVTAVGLSAGAAAPAHATGLCVPIVAEGVGQDHGGGNTTATITTHGLLLGTTAASFTIDGVSSAGVASFHGPLDFTTSIGTIRAQLTGTLDTATGAFTSRTTSLTGTGLFRRVSGNLTLSGVEDLQTGAFTETIRGRLCI